jgi:hypothetical protein
MEAIILDNPWLASMVNSSSKLRLWEILTLSLRHYTITLEAFYNTDMHQQVTSATK